MAKERVVVIGGGHNGLVAAAYLAKAGKDVTLLERSDAVGGILRNTEIAPGFTAPGIAHTVGRLRASVIKDLKLAAFGLELIEPDVRVFAPQPDGSAVTFWADAARTAEGLKPRHAHDAAAYPAFDQKVRAVASFLAYINAITPPDAKSPSIADAIAGLKLGKAFRDLGAKTGREAIRALPMAVADLVAEVFEDEAIRGPLATRGVLYTSTGPWAAGSAAVFLMDSAGNDGGAPGQSTIAKGGSGALAAALEASATAFGVEDPDRSRGRRDPLTRRARRGRDARRTARRSTPRRWSRPPIRSGRCRSATRSSSGRAWSGARPTSASRA